MSVAHPNPTSGKVLVSAVSILALSIALASPSHAASLGSLSVLSTIGEPLKAEIEIFGVTDEEADDLDIALASDTDYENAGSQRTSLMETLQLKIVQQGRRRLVQIETATPLGESIYGLWLELRANGESTLAEFAVMPEETVKTAESVLHDDRGHEPASPQVSASEATSPPESPLVDSQASEPPAEVAGKGAENLALNDPQQTAKQHVVQRGENLTLIARQHGIPETDLDKFIAAIYNENPEGFLRQNLHYLKAGAVLALPSEASVQMVDDKTARKTISVQWQSFKSMLPLDNVQTARETASTRSSERKLTGGSHIAGAVAGDRLTLAALKRPDAEAAGKTEEEAIAARKAAEEASERIRLLEKNILDLKSSMPATPTPTAPADAAETHESFWGIFASPARDLVMQGATLLLLAALVLLNVIRRQAK